MTSMPPESVSMSLGKTVVRPAMDQAEGSIAKVVTGPCKRPASMEQYTLAMKQSREGRV